MTEWAVTIDTVAVEPATDEQLGQVADLLAEYGAAISASEDRIGVTMTVDATNALDAAERGLGHWRELLTDVGVMAGITVAVEAITVDEQERRLAEPTLPELWSAGEIATELGVTRQRVHQLSNDNPRFPDPILRPASGPLWLADAVRTFNQSWQRKAGRPRKATAAGTYRCATCAAEIAVDDASQLPPCPGCGAGTWEVVQTAEAAADNARLARGA